MENYQYILGLLESIFGKGKKDKNKNSFDYAFYCPFCNHKNPKLIVNVKSGKYNCWTCEPKTKGKTPISLLIKFGADNAKIKEMKSYFSYDKTEIPEKRYQQATLPKEFISLQTYDNSHEMKIALAYLFSRGITKEDIIKYNIGYCKYGKYKQRVIIPSYNKFGQLNYFIARAYDDKIFIKYDAPSIEKDKIIGFEYFINWELPIILCEGAFDAIAIKRNAIPLFGKTISKELMKKLVESKIKTVYLALDNDALKASMKYAEELLSLGKEVYLIELSGKDPSILGFEKIIKLLQKAKSLNFSALIAKKLNLSFS